MFKVVIRNPKDNKTKTYHTRFVSLAHLTTIAGRCDDMTKRADIASLPVAFNDWQFVSIGPSNRQG